ncbi:hypothetical protein I4U23_027253 [Adineta vaga]|nr:hypothetical protein I4U23_027253 [Adineta vaga]
MERFIILLIIFFQRTESLKCISPQDQEFNLEQYDPTSLEKTLNAFTLIKIDTDKICAALMNVNYEQQSFKIELFPAKKANTPTDNDYLFQSSFTYEKDKKISLVHELELTCSNYDGCEKRLILDHMEWLFNATYNDFHRAIGPIIIGNNQSGSCFIDSKSTVNCPSKKCIASQHNQTVQFTQSCNDVKNYPPVVLIYHKVNSITFDEARSIAFRCEYHECNKEDILLQIVSLVNTNYDISCLRNRLKGNRTCQTMKTITSSSQTSVIMNFEKVTFQTSLEFNNTSYKMFEITTFSSSYDTTKFQNNASQYHSVDRIVIMFISGLLIIYHSLFSTRTKSKDNDMALL